jgi:hypothetical protein
MAQQIALLIHFHAASAQKANVDRSFVCHHSSHILIHEKDTCNYLLNMKPLIVAAKENTNVQTPLSYDEVAEKLSLTDTDPCAVVLECPHREIGGKCTPYKDLEKISQLCRQRGIAFHMDGARLWEAIAHYTACTTSSGAAVTAHDLCALFDSIYVSCYKGIGGMTGAVLLGTRPFIAEARVWLRRFGGNVFTLLPYAVSSYSCYRNYVKWNMAASEENAASVNGTEGALPVPYAMADRLKRMQSIVALLSTADAGLRPYVRFDTPVPQVCLIHVYIRADAAVAMKAHARSLQETGIACFARLRPAAPVLGDQAHTFPQESYFEFNMVSVDFAVSYSWISLHIAAKLNADPFFHFICSYSAR